MAETARRDLDRIFNKGGVAALVGNTYGAAKDVGVYVTGEAIRGLADLEAKERERSANFATKAVAAGLVERTETHRKGNLSGRITLDDEWYMGPGGKELVACGRKPADHDQSAVQGIHAQNPLILVDEACSVPKSIFDAVDALATNSNARVLAIGNPDDPSSHFAQICKPGSGWHVINVSAFDTPAYTGEDVPEELLSLLDSPEWVEERKIRWGVTSPIYSERFSANSPISPMTR